MADRLISAHAHQATPSIISRQTSVKVVGDRGTSVAQRLATAVDDPLMGEDLRETLDSHKVVLRGERPDIW